MTRRDRTERRVSERAEAKAAQRQQPEQEQPETVPVAQEERPPIERRRLNLLGALMGMAASVGVEMPRKRRRKR